MTFNVGPPSRLRRVPPIAALRTPVLPMTHTGSFPEFCSPDHLANPFSSAATADKKRVCDTDCTPVRRIPCRHAAEMRAFSQMIMTSYIPLPNANRPTRGRYDAGPCSSGNEEDSRHGCALGSVGEGGRSQERLPGRADHDR